MRTEFARAVEIAKAHGRCVLCSALSLCFSRVLGLNFCSSPADFAGGSCWLQNLTQVSSPTFWFLDVSR